MEIRNSVLRQWEISLTLPKVIVQFFYVLSTIQSFWLCDGSNSQLPMCEGKTLWLSYSAGWMSAAYNEWTELNEINDWLAWTVKNWHTCMTRLFNLLFTGGHLHKLADTSGSLSCLSNFHHLLSVHLSVLLCFSLFGRLLMSFRTLEWNIVINVPA